MKKIGLTSKEVQIRINNNQINKTSIEHSRTIKDIIFTNLFTTFNMLNITLACLVLLTKSYVNMLFMGTVISNLLIGIFQEVRSKLTLDRLKLLNETNYDVYRDNKLTSILSGEIVLDDVVLIKVGQQIPSDAILISDYLEVNESLLTGESDAIKKQRDDFLYAGSYTITNEALIKIIKVGNDNYISTLLKQVKAAKKQNSTIKYSLNLIIKVITFFIIPLGIALFIKQYYFSNDGFNASILQTVGALVGMIPEGLVLLTSIALAIGALNLVKHQTLTKEIYSLETLARVDVLCLDKTGTLTTGKMQVINLINFTNLDLSNMIANAINYIDDKNSTALAIKDYFKIKEPLILSSKTHFSSENKYSSTYINEALFKLGAIEYLNLNINTEKQAILAKYNNSLNRIIGVSYASEFVGFIILKDTIRPYTKETLKHFEEQKVNIKIISGDGYDTVLNIAKECGVKDYHLAISTKDLDDETLKELSLTHNVFTRVNPYQKKLIIQTLNNNNHTTAMVGDGVNDIMALKEANCSIAMKDGSDALKDMANLILLNNDFSNLVQVLNEGRRVINNIERTSTLFLTKTIMSFFIAFLTVFFIDSYPFLPIQLTLVSTLCIGIPAFILSLEPNYELVTSNFLANILKKALPSGLAIVIIITIYQVLANFNIINYDILSTLSLYSISMIIYYVLYKLVKKLTLIRILLLIFTGSGLVIALTLFKDFFFLINLNVNEYIILFIVTIFGLICLNYGEKLYNFIIKK